jgi:hypothetical protein
MHNNRYDIARRLLPALGVFALFVAGLVCGGGHPALGGGAGGGTTSSVSSSSSGSGGGPCPGGALAYDPPTNRITIVSDLSSCSSSSTSSALATCIAGIANGALAAFRPIASAPDCPLGGSWYLMTDHGDPNIKYDGASLSYPALVQDYARVPSLQFFAVPVTGQSAAQIFDDEQGIFATLRAEQPYPQDQSQAVVVTFTGATQLSVLLGTFGNTAKTMP